MRSGRSTSTDNLVLKALPGEKGVRIGIVVTKKLGGAVERNRIRRRIREQLVEIGRFPYFPALDLIVIPKPGTTRLPPPELASQILHGMEQLGYSGE